MYFLDHGEPHFHAVYAEYQAKVRIHDAELIAGRLPPTASKMIRTWAAIHREELLLNWRRLMQNERPTRIDPLP